MKKAFLFLAAFCFLCQTYKSIFACSMIYKPPLKFDSTEYIFIGRITDYTGPLFSDSLGRSFQGLVVEVIDPIYMPNTVYGKLKIVPYVLGAACELTTWDQKSFEQQYPPGTELRIVGKESMFIKNNLSDNIVLDINPRNMFTLSRNFKEPAILFSTKNSIYDYRYACIDSNKSFKNLLSIYSLSEPEDLYLSFQEQYHFELRKDLYRLSVAPSDAAKEEIIKRLFSFSSYSKKDFREIISTNIKSEKIRNELISLMPKRFERPSPDTTLHSEIPASLSSSWYQTNGPYGGSVSCLDLKENSDKSLTLFAGTRTNGVFRSTNGGKNWLAVNSGLTKPYIYTLFINGHNIYAGTDSGAFRSSDDGESWIAINNGFEIKKIFRVYTFDVSEKYLFAGTNSHGVFRSSDNGENWFAVNSGVTNLQINCLLHYGKYLFAGTYGGIFVSTDDGDNWRGINEGLPNRLYPDTKSLWLYINTILMSGEKLFIGTEENGMYSSTDFGETWVPVNLDLKNIRVYSIKGNPLHLFVSTSQGIFRSTDNGEDWIKPEKIFSRFSYTSIAIYDSILYTGNNGVHYSTDNGERWNSINAGLNNTIVNELAVSGKNLIAKIYTEGIFLSSDNGFSWSCINADLPLSEFRTIACDDKNIFVGTTGGIFLSMNYGKSLDPDFGKQKCSKIIFEWK